ncbi:hypothetical protein G7Y41_09370 [Schaalia sp. ZJ405]|uniref:hypothetical protein n=1 Tax=Schaalia sp. ZJ405 TaxID=2709403 RepID=UPI0013EC0AB0|nr:hypothetical protein [Schaalia sp. ZJ405]QPK81224.1 hypothetical protein G7Y41_09370 [Schaalia sp. ZJ405]
MPSVDLKKFDAMLIETDNLLHKFGKLIDPKRDVSVSLQRSGDDDEDLLSVEVPRLTEDGETLEFVYELTLSDWRDMTPEQIDDIGRQVVYEASKKLLNV